MMTVLDLFSGIGGFSLGLERTGGFRTVAFCEIDPFCQKVLAKHWPGVPIHDDVRTLEGFSSDVITGGYPCQPFSFAGERRGAADDRHLWPEMYRIVKSVRPRWVVAENVAGHIRMGLDQVLSDMEAIGYTCWTFVVPACAVDAPHRRDRVWIIGNANGYSKSNGPVNAEASGMQAMADSQRVGQSGQRESFHASDYPAGRDWQTNKSFDVCERREWKPEPGVGRVAHGIPRRMDRLRALGNAVVPQIPEVIGRAILEANS